MMVNDEICYGDKLSKIYLTFSLGANANAIEKLLLLDIVRYRYLRCLLNVKLLQVQYESNNNNNKKNS